MTETTVSGNVFSYPVNGGDHLYSIYQYLNAEFNLNITKENYKDSITEIGLDGFPTLTVRDNENVPVYIFVNKDYKQKDIKTMDVMVKDALVGHDSTYINFPTELNIFSNKPLDTPIIYSYATTKFLRDVKLLLSQYGYGIIPIISDSKYQLNGMKVMYYGPGAELTDNVESIRKSPLVVKLAIPSKEGWREVYLKTG